MRVTGAVQTRFVSLIPVNVSRGVITLERIRGTFEVYFSSAEIADSLENWFVHLQIQLVPAENAAISVASVLAPSDSADQESNRIVWQRLYYPNSGTTITQPGALEMHTSTSAGMEIDVKVKRRFDRANWALALVYDCNLVSEALNLGCGQLRALFKSSDGV